MQFTRKRSLVAESADPIVNDEQHVTFRAEVPSAVTPILDSQYIAGRCHGCFRRDKVFPRTGTAASLTIKRL
jgi:hypothetical protein